MAVPTPDDLGWPIPLPQEEDRYLDRVLEARDSTGAPRARWRYNGDGWQCFERTAPESSSPLLGTMGGLYYLFEEIVELSIKYQWTLASIPPVTPPTIPTDGVGFRGAKYTDEYRDVTAIAQDVRTDIRAARAAGELILPESAKVSVTCSRYSMGQSIDVVVRGLTREELWVSYGTPGSAGSPSHGGRSPLRVAAETKLTEILQAYNRNDSNSMTDHYDVLFSGQVRFAEPV